MEHIKEINKEEIEEIEFTRGLIEKHFINFEWVVVKTPYDYNFTGRRFFSHYGSICKLTDEHIFLLNRKGLNKIPLSMIEYIGEAKKPVGY